MQHSEQSHASDGSSRIMTSNHDTSLCYTGGWIIWKCELYQISSCTTHGSWNLQTILEPKSVFLIHVKIVDFRVTFNQPPLNVCNSRIDALSCNDFPSQHRGEGHIILSDDRSYSNVRFFPGDTDSRSVVVVNFLAQGIRNHIRFTGVIMNLKIIVLDQLQPSPLPHVQIVLSEKYFKLLWPVNI
jgi:hypothetical protein